MRQQQKALADNVPFLEQVDRMAREELSGRQYAVLPGWGKRGVKV
jgi:hypothetical protein